MHTHLRSGLLRTTGIALVLAGCGDPTPAPTDASVRDDVGASQLIGPAGGVIFAPGLTFTVPPGALADPTAITITRTDTPVPAGYVGYSPVWRFAPEGLTFARPATVDITFDGDSARAGLYWSQPAGGYERLPATVAGSHLVGPVSHFSLGFVGDLLRLDAGTADATVDRPDADTADVTVDRPDAAFDAGTDDVAVDHPDAVFDAADVLAAPDVPDVSAVPDVPSVPAPRPIAPLSGSHVPSRRPGLRWSLPVGVASARITICRDRALTTDCVTFDATGTTGAPAVDLAPGVWFWGLRGLVGGVAGGVVGPVWRLRVASATVAGARPWGSDPDVNGDGYSDVIAAVADTGASIYLGGATGPSVTPVTVAAPLDSTHFGQAIDFAGDVNGDGYGDVVVGAPGSNGVYVYRGTATGVDPTPGVVTGPVGSGLGSAVAGAGDVNGDGFDDVVAVNPSGNAVWFVPGGTGGLGTAVRVNVPLTSTASTLVGTGDVDGDGYADVLLAGAGSNGQLLRGGASGLDGARSVAVDRTSGAAGDLNGDGRGDLAFVSGTTARVVLGAGTIDSAGSPIAGVLAAESGVSPRGGDYNGDGFDDLVIAGNVNYDGVPVARTIVAPGGAAGVGAALALVSGFGSATVRGPVGAGDVDGDGVDDLLSRQSGSTDLYLTRGSRAGLVFGGLAHLDVSGNSFYGYSSSWSPVGDVDRDGYDDVAIGQTIYRGTAAGLSATGRWTLPYERNNYVVGVGDLNHDGYMDVGVATLGFGAPGYAWLRASLGSATGPGATVYTVADAFLSAGEEIVSYQGFSGAGDIDGDGFDDLLVGQHTDLVYFGRASFTTPLRTIRSPASWYFYVGEAGDTNHDGFADIVARARSESTDSVVVAGAATGLGATLAVLPSNALPVAIGDVNGDAFADLAVSTAAGVEIHLGSSTGPATSAAFTLPAGTPYAAGDVNHDGHPDLIVTRTDRVRRADLYLGTGTGFATTPSLTWPDFSMGVRTRGAAGFGDIDGDGFDDVVMFHDRGVAVQRFDVAGPRPIVLTLTGSDGSAVAIYR